MIDTIYLETAAKDHPRTLALLQRFKRARVIEIERYGEVFNRAGQNFRLQKTNPALIIAYKQGETVLPTPPEYGIGGDYNYYFSHMLNCLYDCRYCFLQGMHRSAHYVLFINYETFYDKIEALSQTPGSHWFFSGYDCDSLAMEPVTQFTESTLPLFARLPNATLELRTKSTQIRYLLKTTPLQNVVVAFSLSPEPTVQSFEEKTPSLQKRLQAIRQLQQQGWPIGLRLDPLVDCQDFEQHYHQFLDLVFSYVDPSMVHSISLGTFRLPKPYFKRLEKLYPETPLLAPSMQSYDNLMGYTEANEQRLLKSAYQAICDHCPKEIIYPCRPIN